jgi:SNF2 family DNA or RNA helicase
MIQVKLISNEIRLYFSGSNFLDILDIVKEHYLKYNKEGKYYTGSNCQFYNCLNELKKIEEFEINEEIEKILKPKINVKFKRHEFKKELLKSTPLGEYQIQDIKRMLNCNGILNGSECGLGKTIETITVINHLFDSKEIDKILIVTFAQTLYNWKRELLLFSDFFKEEDIIIANKDLRNPFDYDCKIIICSYNTLTLIAKYYSDKKITKKSRNINIPIDKWGNNRCIILDEAHSIKEDSLRSKLCMLIKDYFSFKYLLTGTPYPNNISELYNLLKFIDENIIYNDRKHFNYSLAKKINHFGVVTKYNEEKVKEFLIKTDSFIFRRFKKDVLPNLPKQNIKKIFVEMNKKQRNIYQLIISNKLQSLKVQKGEIFVKDVMSSFPYLILSCSDPSILKGKLIDNENSFFNDEIEKYLEEWKFEYNSKLEICNEILNNHENEKIIIWSTHPVTINSLKDYYSKYNPIAIHGKSHESSKLDKEIYRDNLLNEFKTDKNKNLAILNPNIMGTGINIKECTVAIVFDRSFDIKEFLQLLGRNHRGNSENEVTNYILINDNTLENRQDAILDGKEYLNNNLLKYNTLSKEEWVKIFNGNIDNN